MVKEGTVDKNKAIAQESFEKEIKAGKLNAKEPILEEIGEKDNLGGAQVDKDNDLEEDSSGGARVEKEDDLGEHEKVGENAKSEDNRETIEEKASRIMQFLKRRCFVMKLLIKIKQSHENTLKKK